MLIKKILTSYGNWRTRFIFLDIKTGGLRLRDEFAETSVCLHSFNFIKFRF